MTNSKKLSAGEWLRAFFIARKVAILPRKRKGEFAIHSLDKLSVLLEDTPEARSAGFVSLFLEGNVGHYVLKPGFELANEVKGQPTIRRAVSQIIREASAIGSSLPRGWISGWLADKPSDLGLDAREILITGDELILPAWHQPGGSHWVIHVHGRTANRAECLRTFDMFSELGFSNLAISLRNNSEGSDFANRRSHFGALEWRDLEAGVAQALKLGAQTITIFGISQGAVSVAEFLRRSALGRHVNSVILDSPVVSWPEVIEYQLELAGEARRLTQSILRIFSSTVFSRLIGLVKPVELRALGFANWSTKFELPILVLHSRDDGYLPIEPIEKLALRHKTHMTLKTFEAAGHVRIFNSEPVIYANVIQHFIETSIKG